ncbi:MAG: hypothetical protein QXN26_06325 [Thermoplasmataceae archaeon]
MLKGNPLRKRYVLVRIGNLQRRAAFIDRDLYRLFHAKRKYAQNDYAIYLTDQFTSAHFVSYFNEKISDAETMYVSGTIRKCRKVISRTPAESARSRDKSAFLENR